jgi:hypothetical protein
VTIFFRIKFRAYFDVWEGQTVGEKGHNYMPTTDHTSPLKLRKKVTGVYSGKTLKTVFVECLV